jgi:SEC-C motif
MARSEQEIFDELSALCVSPGYVHALAHLCLRDNVVGYWDQMTPEDLAGWFKSDRLIRTEISTLVGLVVKAPINFALPSGEVVKSYVERSDALLMELHEAMSAAGFKPAEWKQMADTGANPFQQGDVLREAIFYSGDSAYSFQYRDFAPMKYGRDDSWLKTHKDFSIAEARQVTDALGRLQNDKLGACLTTNGRIVFEHSVLEGFMFNSEEVAAYSHLPVERVRAVVNAFCLGANECNQKFRALHDFNLISGAPLIQTAEDEYLLFEAYSFLEALYEAPFYWMGADKIYAPTALKHRGLFTEEFARERIEVIFGGKHVHPNVIIVESKGKTFSEIDVLVIFGDRAIVLQAKSKRLTLESRKGNDKQIQDDFKKSVQDAYDQGYLCASVLNNPDYQLKDAAGNDIPRPVPIKEIYVLCVVSDHYPALAFQARQFLQVRESETVKPPFVLDIFALDVIAEMLDSPLRFLSYVNRRTAYANRILAAHELTTLGYHLKSNLWLDDENSMLMLSDDLSTDLMIAMAARRDGVAGQKTPEGILTRFNGTPVAAIVEQVEAVAEPAAIDLGFLLLTLGEDAVDLANKAVPKIARMARGDGKTHDMTVAIDKELTGLTIHASARPEESAREALRDHCHRRKYLQKASTWYGICVRPSDERLRFALKLDFPWIQDPQLDAALPNTAKPLAPAAALAQLEKKPITGRNEPCPCGSGRKYKKCCLYK